MFHILVVEDDANTRKLMETVLKQNGYQPLLARDGVEALEVLDRKHVDLIVLDIMMPRMDEMCIRDRRSPMRSSRRWRLPAPMTRSRRSGTKAKPKDRKNSLIF